MFEIVSHPRRCRFGVVCFAFLGLAIASAAQTGCRVAVQSSVEVRGPSVTLADLLTPDTCAEIRSEAQQVRLGAVPSEGSSRVLLGDDIRPLLEKLARIGDSSAIQPVIEQIPARIVVRHAGDRASCNEVESALRSNSRLTQSHHSQASPGTECGAGDGIPHGAALQIARRTWDPAAQRWFFNVRCVRSSDCVPFVLSLPPESAARDPLVFGSRLSVGTATGSFHLTHSDDRPVADELFVRRGRAATLLWTQDGIRVSVGTVCMDDGAEGSTVRTRIMLGGKIVRAKVVGLGRLEISD